MATITSARDVGLISTSVPASAIIWEEMTPGVVAYQQKTTLSADGIFVFQYWPDSLSDTYTPNYSEKAIPGGSHPLLQWTGGSGRSISFNATFTSEIDTSQSGSSVLAKAAASLQDVSNLPSSRYTVDVAAAIARLQSYLRGDYPDSSLRAKPPKRLYLALENTKLGGNTDEILTVLRGASVTITAWFASGTPRVADLALQFSEVVQHGGDASNASQIKFIGRSSFEQGGKNYKYRGSIDRVQG